MPNHDDLLSQEDKPDYQQILKDKLTFSQSLINSKFPQATTKIIHSRLKQIMDFKEDKIFTMFVAQSLDFFTTQWNYVSQKLPLLPINFKQSVANMVQYRINNVLRDLIEDKIQIQPLKPVVAYNYDSDQKNGKLFILKGQSQQIRKKMLEINNSLKSLESQQMQENELITGDAKDLFAHLYSEQKKKQVEQFIKKKKEQKEQRKKKLQLQRLKEQQQLQQKEKQIKQQEQQQKKQRRQQQLKKNLQLHQKRDQQKASREQKSEEYQKKLKQINEKPRLFELLQKNFEKRKQYEQMEKKHQMKNEKKSIFLNIDDLKIEDHQKKYEQVRKMKQEQRQKRYAEYVQNQQKSRVRHHSSFELSRPTDKQLEQKQRAKQKYQKIKHYQSIVRQKFKPKVDQDKKKEMQTMIQQLQLNSRRKLKKTKLQNGAVVYQEIKETDPRSLGILYLQKTKQMAAKAKLIKATSSSVDLQPQLPKKKQIDYLQELRKNPKPRTSRRLSFIDRPNMSFDEKVNKMLIESQKLNDLVKQNEERLKFGKFKTSQQILNCKQEIDQSYLSIAKMKLKLIKDQ